MQETTQQKTNEPAERRADRSQPSTAEPKRSAIVIADKEPSLTMALAALGSKNIKVRNVQDIAAAIRVLSEPEKPAIIIIAIFNDFVATIDAVKTLRSYAQILKTPILVIAGTMELREQLLLKEAGANAWLTAPYTHELLSKIIEMVIF